MFEKIFTTHIQVIWYSLSFSFLLIELNFWKKKIFFSGFWLWCRSKSIGCGLVWLELNELYNLWVFVDLIVNWEFWPFLGSQAFKKDLIAMAKEASNGDTNAASKPPPSPSPLRNSKFFQVMMGLFIIYVWVCVLFWFHLFYVMSFVLNFGWFWAWFNILRFLVFWPKCICLLALSDTKFFQSYHSGINPLCYMILKMLC